ncbi:MAG: hypothetical protein JSW08_00090 [archaeon]|nr:MAG: hypothetical protein JSW08_00090 [archaeon]
MNIEDFMVLSVGLVLLLQLAGIPTGANTILSWIGIDTSASGISLSSFLLTIGAIFALGTGAGIAISYFTKSPSESWVVATGLAPSVLTLVVLTFVSIINYTKEMGYVYYLTYLIFVPLIAGFGISLVSFWRGSGK